MDVRIAEIVIWDNRAFVAAQARYRNGLFTSVEPVHVVDPELDELVPLVQSILTTEPKMLPDPTQEEVKAQRDLLPNVTGARSWRRLCQKGISYVIQLSPKGFLLEMSRLDSKGRWEFDPDKQTRFGTGTDLSIVIQTALNDLKARVKQPAG